MSAQPANIDDDDRRRRQAAWEDLRRLRDELAAANPDMTDEDWDDVAEQWAAEVDEGLRDIVRRSRGELTSTST